MGAELTLSLSEVAGSVNGVNNTSRVRVHLAVTTYDGTWSHDGTTYGYINLDGREIANLKGAWVDKNTTTVIHSAEHEVKHNDDGSKIITVDVGFNLMTTYTGWVYASKTLTLTTIPRASSLTVPGITLGADNTLNISAASQSFKHTITYQFGNASGTAKSDVAGGPITWETDISLCNQIPDSTSGYGTLTLITYNNGSEIGRNSHSFTAYVPSSVVPAVTSVRVSPVNTNSVLQSWGVYVKGFSKIGFSVSGSGAYGSSVIGGSFSCAGQSASSLSGTTGMLTAAGSYTPSATVKDSRNRISAKAYGSTITVYDYAVPTISSPSAYRSDANGTASESGTYIAVQCSAACASIGGRNSVSVRARVRLTDGNWSGYTTLENGVQKVLSGFSAQRSYEVELSAEDALGERKTVVYAIPTEAITFMLTDGGEGASFGKYPERSGLDMGWNIHMNGNRVTGLPAPEENTDAVPLGYVDPKYAPSGYGLGKTAIAYYPTTEAELNASLDSFLDAMQNTSVGFAVINDNTGNVFGGGTFLAEFFKTNEHYATVDFYSYGFDGRRLLKSKYDGIWSEIQWYNPPMFSTEYCTTERWDGNPVYTKRVSLGAFSGTQTVPVGNGYRHLLRKSAVVKFSWKPYYEELPDSMVTDYQSSAGLHYLQVTVGDSSVAEGYLQMWYI